MGEILGANLKMCAPNESLCNRCCPSVSRYLGLTYIPLFVCVFDRRLSWKVNGLKLSQYYMYNIARLLHFSPMKRRVLPNVNRSQLFLNITSMALMSMSSPAMLVYYKHTLYNKLNVHLVHIIPKLLNIMAEGI